MKQEKMTLSQRLEKIENDKNERIAKINEKLKDEVITDRMTWGFIYAADTRARILRENAEIDDHLHYTTTQLCLFDNESDRYVTDNIIESEFGFAFAMPDTENKKFITCYPYQQYYQDRGYTIKLRTRNIICRTHGDFTEKGYLRLYDVAIVDEHFEICEDVFDKELICRRSYVDFIANKTIEIEQKFLT